MNDQVLSFDVVVIGGGHAGCEAAAASARMGAKTALVTHKFETIGVMSCNPAIGGLGKGHLVREIDALDGLMGRVTDQGGIQFRMLNRRKGPAVRGPRAQADRKLYREAMQREIAAVENLTVVEGEADQLRFSGADARSVTGIVLASGQVIDCGAVVLTSGTFLRGLIHIGDRKIPAGRSGEAPAMGLSHSLEQIGFDLGRLKTGTPCATGWPDNSLGPAGRAAGRRRTDPVLYADRQDFDPSDPVSHYADDAGNASDNPG